MISDENSKKIYFFLITHYNKASSKYKIELIFKMEKPELIIPKERDWDDFIIRKSDPLCSGLGGCEVCNKKMLSVRGKYLRSWLQVFIKHKQDIISGKEKIPKLTWIAFDTAPSCTIGKFHRLNCQNNEITEKCQCDLAYLLRAMYANVKEDDTVSSLEMIYKTFKKFFHK